MSDKALWEQFDKNPLEVYSRCAATLRGVGIEKPTISLVLEELSPTKERNDPDAFQRMMREAGIRTQGDRFAGYDASNAGEFLRSEGKRALLGEFFRRNWLRASGQNKQERAKWNEGVRAVLLNSDGVVGSWERPYAESTMVNYNNRVEAAIPLTEITAIAPPTSYRPHMWESSVRLAIDNKRARQRCVRRLCIHDRRIACPFLVLWRRTCRRYSRRQSLNPSNAAMCLES